MGVYWGERYEINIMQEFYNMLYNASELYFSYGNAMEDVIKHIDKIKNYTHFQNLDEISSAQGAQLHEFLKGLKTLQALEENARIEFEKSVIDIKEVLKHSHKPILYHFHDKKLMMSAEIRYRLDGDIVKVDVLN